MNTGEHKQVCFITVRNKVTILITCFLHPIEGFVYK